MYINVNTCIVFKKKKTLLDSMQNSPKKLRWTVMDRGVLELLSVLWDYVKKQKQKQKQKTKQKSK